MHTSGLKRPVVPSFTPDAHHSGPSATRPRTFSPPPWSTSSSRVERGFRAYSFNSLPTTSLGLFPVHSFLLVTYYRIITPQNALLDSPVLVSVNRDYNIITHSIITPLIHQSSTCVKYIGLCPNSYVILRLTLPALPLASCDPESSIVLYALMHDDEIPPMTPSNVVSSIKELLSSISSPSTHHLSFFNTTFIP